MCADHVQLTIVVADHVHVQIDDNLFQLDGRLVHKRARSPEATFLRIEGREYDRMARLVFGKVGRECH